MWFLVTILKKSLLSIRLGIKSSETEWNILKSDDMHHFEYFVDKYKLPVIGQFGLRAPSVRKKVNFFKTNFFLGSFNKERTNKQNVGKKIISKMYLLRQFENWPMQKNEIVGNYNRSN